VRSKLIRGEEEGGGRAAGRTPQGQEIAFAGGSQRLTKQRRGAIPPAYGNSPKREKRAAARPFLMGKKWRGRTNPCQREGQREKKLDKMKTDLGVLRVPEEK